LGAYSPANVAQGGAQQLCPLQGGKNTSRFQFSALLKLQTPNFRTNYVYFQTL